LYSQSCEHEEKSIEKIRSNGYGATSFCRYIVCKACHQIHADDDCTLLSHCRITGPQVGSKLEEVKRSGVDLMIALDVSNSMKAEDIRPNRLERSKQAISILSIS